MSGSIWATVLQRLSADATLYGILGGTSAAPRVGPTIEEQSATIPYITVEGSTSNISENIDEDMITVKIVSDNMATIESAKARVITLLNLENDARVMTDSNNYVYYCRLSSAVQFTDGATLDFYEELGFRVVYKRR